MPPGADPTPLRRSLKADLVRMVRAVFRDGWRAVHDVEPEFWRNLRDELLAGRQWIDRAVVLAWAAATGLLVVGFTLLAEASIHGFQQLEQWGPCGRYLPLIWTPALTVVPAVVDAPVRAGGQGVWHSPGREGPGRRPSTRAERVAGLTAHLLAQDGSCLWRASCGFVDWPRRSDGAGGGGGHGACAALVVATLGHRCARPHGGGCRSRHCGRVQHAVGGHRLRAGAVDSPSQHLPQLPRDLEHRPGGPGGRRGLWQRDLLRAAAGAATVLVAAASGADGSLGLWVGGRVVRAADGGFGTRTAGSFQPMAPRASLQVRRRLCGGGGRDGPGYRRRHGGRRLRSNPCLAGRAR